MLSAFVIAEIERLGARAKSTLFDIEWPKGLSYRTVADSKADREVWWAEFASRPSVDAPYSAFGTSDGGKRFLCIRRDDDQPEDPIVYIIDRDRNVSESSRASIFFASLEREPTRKKR